MRKEISEKEKQEKLWLIERKESLAMSEKDLSEQERIVREEVKAADELLNDATKKLEEALSASSVNKTSVSAAKMILDTACEKHGQVMSKRQNWKCSKVSWINSTQVAE